MPGLSAWQAGSGGPGTGSGGAVHLVAGSGCQDSEVRRQRVSVTFCPRGSPKEIYDHMGVSSGFGTSPPPPGKKKEMVFLAVSLQTATAWVPTPPESAEANGLRAGRTGLRGAGGAGPADGVGGEKRGRRVRSRGVLLGSGWFTWWFHHLAFWFW